MWNAYFEFWADKIQSFITKLQQYVFQDEDDIHQDKSRLHSVRLRQISKLEARYSTNEFLQKIKEWRKYKQEKHF